MTKTAIATQLFGAGGDVYVVADLCASPGRDNAHEAGLRVLSRIVGRDRLVLSGDLGD